MRLLLLAVSIFAALPTRAAADDVVLIESLSGTAPSRGELDQLAPVLGEPRALTGEALRARLDEKLGARPARLDPSQLAELLGRFARAEEALFYRGSQARAALPEIEQLLERVRAASATRAHNPSARQMHRSALLALGRAYAQTPSEPKLAALFTELATHFPDQPIDAQRDGLRLHQLFSEYVGKLRHGSLEIVSRGRSTVFVNGRPVGVDRLTVPEGRYEIFASSPAGDGRVRVVEVKAGSVHKVVLALELDLALEAEEGGALRFADDGTQRRRDRELAEELRQLLVVKQLYLLRRRGVEPGILFRLRDDGVAERTLPVASDRDGVLAAARELVAAPSSGAKIETAVDLAAAPTDTRPPAARRPVRLAAWGVFAAGAALLAAGLVADALHGVGTCRATDRLCAETYGTRPLGPALGGLGAGLTLVAATTLVATDGLDARRGRPLRTLGILLTGTALPAILGGALYLKFASTREAAADGATQPLSRKTPAGVAAVSVGSAMLVSGVALIVADALKKSVAPIASVGRDSAFVGVGGRF